MEEGHVGVAACGTTTTTTTSGSFGVLPEGLLEYILYATGILGAQDVVHVGMASHALHRCILENRENVVRTVALAGPVALALREGEGVVQGAVRWEAAVAALGPWCRVGDPMLGEEAVGEAPVVRVRPELAFEAASEAVASSAVVAGIRAMGGESRGGEEEPEKRWAWEYVRRAVYLLPSPRLRDAILNACVEYDTPLVVRLVHVILVERFVSDSGGVCSCCTAAWHAALLASIRKESLGLVKALLWTGRAVPHQQESVALRTAAEVGNTEIFQLVLDAPEVDPAARDSVAVGLAAMAGHAGVLALLLSLPDVDPSVGDNYAIFMAARKGYLEIVEMLLADPRVDPAAGDSEALRTAVMAGHIDVVRALTRDDRVNPAAQNNAALRWALRNNAHDVAQVLLSDPRVLALHSNAGAQSSSSFP